MKRFLPFIAFLAFFMLTEAKSDAFCRVTMEDATPGNIYGLPWQVNPLYNGRSRESALCSAGDYDRWLGFDQAIIFATREAGTFVNTRGDRIDVNQISLGAPLTFSNPAVNVVVGNQPLLLPSPSAYDYPYPVNYTPFQDQGIVTLDCRSHFGPGQRCLQCGSGTGNVILRNLVINTNGINRASLFNQTDSTSSCFKDGGAVYVCGGTRNAAIALDQPGWCGDEDRDGDGVTIDGGDCNDGDADRFPGNPEICDGKDNDCNAATNDVFNFYYHDVDGDGFGHGSFLTPGSWATGCEAPTGFVSNNTDCNDSNRLVNPRAIELCTDSIDNNCNGTVSEGCVCVNGAARSCGTTDVGPCTFGTQTCIRGAWGTCRGEVAPVAETCGGTVDLNCDGALPPACPVVDLDNDGDGYFKDNDGNGLCPGSVDGVSCDCDDARADVHPGTAEICGDGIDNDCNGGIDPDSLCRPVDPLTTDNDGDGYCEDTTVCTDGSLPKDCDDTDPSIYPAAAEICGDGIDQDCTGADTACPPACPAYKQKSYYLDADHDDFGTVNTSVLACTQPVGYVLYNTDCDDGDALKNPGMDEICGDGIDNDCDEKVDEGCAGDPHVDDDHDSYCEDPVSCSDGSKPGDCNDANPLINPGSTENCGDGVDTNCDGIPDILDPVCGGNVPPPIPTGGGLICPIPGNALNACPMAGGAFFGGCSLNRGMGAQPFVFTLFLTIPLLLIYRFVSIKKAVKNILNFSRNFF